MTATSADILLIDASPYIFRSFFALPSSLRAPDGAPINAVQGFAGFLLKILGEERPSHVGVAFDGSLTSSFRNELYPEYKSNRDLPPEDLKAQLDSCRDVASALGLHTAISDRYEADDLIGSWIETYDLVTQQQVTWVVTSDKDLGQLVSGRVGLYDYAKAARWRSGDVLAKFGVPPERLVDYLALAGDPVDNIPGVRGLGPKTAVVLLDQFEGIEAIYQDLDRVERLEVRGAKSVRRKLEEQRDLAFLSRELATIHRGAAVASELADLSWAGVREQAWIEVCQRLGAEGLRDRGLALGD